MKNVTLWTCVLLFLSACNNRQRQAEYEAKIRATEINVPLDSMKCLMPEKSIALSGCNDSAQLRYVVYFDSAKCSPCQLGKMEIWHSIIKLTKDIDANVDFQFIFYPKSSQRAEFEKKYYSRKTQLRVFIDTTGIIERHNPLLAKSSIFHAFVLNDSNHIEVIGDASKSELVERKYYEFLRKKKAERNAP